MESALIISLSEKSNLFFSEMLSAASYKNVVKLGSCSEARQLLLERDFDLVIINSPLKDESGESLAKHIATKEMCQVILVVKSEHFEEISLSTEEYGILTVSSTLNRALLWPVIKLAGASQNRLKRMREENTKLAQKIEDIRIVDRAKCILISHHSMSEQEAHKYIEKKAMDMRVTRRIIAEKIIGKYEKG